MIVPTEQLNAIIDEAVNELEKDEDGRKAVQWHRERAANSEVNFYQWISWRAKRIMVDNRAEAWLAEKQS